MPKPSTAKPSYECAQCGRSFVWIPIRSRPPVTCSAECKAERSRQRDRDRYAETLQRTQRRRKHGSVYHGKLECSIDGCPLFNYSSGLCYRHYARKLRTGTTDARPKRPHYEAWTDARSGYVYVTTPGEKRPRLQHRLVMEQILGRPLLPSENVHHINGKRDDNRPENLELWSKSQPAGQRVVDKVEWAVELLKLYAPCRLAA